MATMKVTMLETTGTHLTVIKRQGPEPDPDRRRNPQGVDRELQIKWATSVTLRRWATHQVPGGAAAPARPDAATPSTTGRFQLTTCSHLKCRQLKTSWEIMIYSITVPQAAPSLTQSVAGVSLHPSTTTTQEPSYDVILIEFVVTRHKKIPLPFYLMP